jgi:hypothetical protein
MIDDTQVYCDCCGKPLTKRSPFVIQLWRHVDDACSVYHSYRACSFECFAVVHERVLKEVTS